MFTVFAGLSSAIFYAFGSLVQQSLSRARGLCLVLCWRLPVGVAILLPLALVINGPPITAGQWRSVAYSSAAGALILVVSLMLLRAFQIGDFSLIGPLSSLEGLFFALLAIAKGDKLTPLIWLGIALAIVGGTLTAIRGRARSIKGAGWAVVSSAFWMLTLVLFRQSAGLSWLSQAAWSRLASLVLFLPVALVVLRRSRRTPAEGPRQPHEGMRRKHVVLYLGATLFELVGLIAATIAVQRGPLTIAGIAVAQYATVAVLIGLVLLKERPRPHQLAGVVCTIAAVSLLCLG